jgi:hypothetical protein
MSRNNIFFITATLIMLMITGNINAQAPNFSPVISASFGGSSSEEFFGAAKTADGGYILSGLTNSYDGDINQTVVYDTANTFVVRTDASGNKLWAYAYGGNDYDKARFAFEDNASNIIVIGTTFSTDGDITFNNGNSDLFVLKLDPSGNIIWMKQYGGTGNESGRYAEQLSDGNYLVGGYTTSSNFDVPINRGAHDGWLLKIDTSGTVIWSNTYGGSQGERLRYFVEAPDGSIYFAGASQSSDFQCSGNQGDFDFWVGKTDASGNLLWNYQYGGSLGDAGYQIAAISDNRYVLTGNTESSDGDVTGYKGGTTDGWVVMVDSSGQFIRQACLGGTRGDRLYNTLEKEPGHLIAAGFSSSSDLDLTGANNGPTNEFWLVSLDTLLQHQWSYATGGSGGDLGTELIYDPADSSFTIVGESNSVNGTVTGNHGGVDFWMVKLAVSTGIASADENLFSAWYQHFSHTVVIRSSQQQHAVLNVYDALGRSIQPATDLKLASGENRIALPALAGSPGGLYFISVKGPQSDISLRVITTR